ncbi:AMP-dependent synthetase [Roseibium aquae]|uniref:3-methylmercaptopropionyl-CoA ligase n=1 Tax=Roseibium aquae TaxID=1323746 RepID=A0A916WVU2_9HYPH|nr:AMP-binding protein [Roseibium aquae]GGB36558.1 AMP-dependent synthetase [Roseibium aquae]
MNVAHWLHRTAVLGPDLPALYHGADLHLTYAALRQRVKSLSAGLADRFGVRPGDRVALFMGNTPAYLEVLYAIWHLGAAAVPINYKLHPKEAQFILEDSGARLVFVADGNGLSDPYAMCEVCCVHSEDYAALTGRDDGDGEPAPRARDDLAWLFYTSGTTGKPKGVMISHGNIHAMAFAYFVDVDEVRPDDTALYAAPLSHGAGIYNFMHVMRGAAHCVPKSGGFDPAEILSLGKTFGSVHMFAAPTMVRRLVDAAKAAGETGEGIRTIVYGGGPMYLADIMEAVQVMGPRFVQIYGQGECPMTITALPRDLVSDRAHPRWKERLGSVGTAQSCVEVRVVDEAGRICAPGESGEIVVRGAAVMPGYWNNPEANAKTLKDGWLHTGDVGRFDEDGFLTLTDRSKDVIISGGTNIYPREVEEVLLLLDDVAEVSVVGAPDPEWGEVIVAFVVLRQGGELSPEALDRHCLENMARFKRPKRYEFLPELPKNTYGKVLKTDLRRRFSDEKVSP